MPRLTVHARRALVEERREQILTAAARVFAEKGFDRATIRDVAQEAGLSEGSIYNYFKNKQDLLIHLPRHFMQPALEAFQSAMEGETPLSPETLLKFVAENIVRVITENRKVARILITTLPIMDETLRAEYIRDVPSLALSTLEKFIRTEQANGVVRADLDPVITARVFPGMMLFSLMIQEIIQPPNLPRLDYDKMISHFVEIFLHGILNDGGRRTRDKVKEQSTDDAALP